MDNCTISPKLFHLLLAPVRSLLQTATVKHQSNWHLRKFSAYTHFGLSLYAQFAKVESANALLEELNDLAPATPASSLRQLLDFDWIDPYTGGAVQLNQSSFSRANTKRSYRLWRTCFEGLWPLALRQLPCHKFEGLGQIIAVNGSLFDCLTRMAWATYRTNCCKVKGHFFFDLGSVPTHLVLTTGTGSEREALRQNLQPNITYIFDRGYNDYSLFAAVRENKAHFVTRLLSNASYRVAQTLALTHPQIQAGVQRDEAIYFNNDEHKGLWRLVTVHSHNGEQFQYLTSRFDLTAQMVADLYCYRWEIETFFWWIKSHLQLRHWYSECENGLLIQIYAALIAYILLKLYGLYSGRTTAHQMPLHYVRWVRRHLAEQQNPDKKQAYLAFLGIANTVMVT